MTESQNHVDLVYSIYNYIKCHIEPENVSRILADTLETKHPINLINGFIPDVYYWHDDLLIIGEAKTLNDFDNKHSYAQFNAYLNECEKFWGNAILVVAVPFVIIPKAKNYFTMLRRRVHFKARVILLNEIGQETVV